MFFFTQNVSTLKYQVNFLHIGGYMCNLGFNFLNTLQMYWSSNSSGLYISMIKCYVNKTETLCQKTPPWCAKTFTLPHDTEWWHFIDGILIYSLSQQQASVKVIQGFKNMSFQHLNLFLFLCCDQEVNDQVLHTK